MCQTLFPFSFTEGDVMLERVTENDIVLSLGFLDGRQRADLEIGFEGPDPSKDIVRRIRVKDLFEGKESNARKKEIILGCDTLRTLQELNPAVYYAISRMLNITLKYGLKERKKRKQLRASRRPAKKSLKRKK